MNHCALHGSAPHRRRTAPPAAWLSAAIAAALLFVSANALRAQASASAPAQPPPDPFVAVAAKVRPSVGAVGSYFFKDTPTVKYFGTGFAVGDGHTVLTNAHVVEAVRKADRLDYLRVFFPGDRQVEGRKAVILFEDPLHDVAVLRIEGAPVPALTLAAAKDEAAPQGLGIGIMGYPIGLILGLVPAVHRGVVAATVPSVLPLPKGARLTPDLVKAIQNPFLLYQLDIVALPGNSGSPLFDARSGEVIGIINKVLGNRTREHLIDNPSGISYAVPSRWLREAVIRSSIKAEKEGRDAPSR